MSIYEKLNNVKLDLNEYKEYSLSEEDKTAMKNNFLKSNKKPGSVKKYIVLAACICTIAVFSQTAMAQSILSNIIKTFTTGHNQFAQMSEDFSPKLSEPEDGNKLETIPEGGIFYSKDGTSVISVKGDGNLAEHDGKVKDNTLRITNADEIKNYLGFDAKLPTDLPQGWTLSYAELYKDENGVVSGDYLSLYYNNPDSKDQIFIQERIINDATAFDSAEKEEIRMVPLGDGIEAVMIGTHELNWEANGVSHTIIGKNVLNEDSLIKMANTMK